MGRTSSKESTERIDGIHPPRGSRYFLEQVLKSREMRNRDENSRFSLQCTEITPIPTPNSLWGFQLHDFHRSFTHLIQKKGNEKILIIISWHDDRFYWMQILQTKAEEEEKIYLKNINKQINDHRKKITVNPRVWGIIGQPWPQTRK